jgi:GTP-binding protein
MALCVTIVGRENVGKSTLFNKLVKEKASIVFNQPGVTRDCQKKRCQMYDIEFDIIDTAGWHLRKTDLKFNHIIKEQVISAIKEADVIMFVIDGQSRICTEDLLLAQLVRKSKKSVILIENKSERLGVVTSQEIRSLGFGKSLRISAEHKIGFESLYDRLLKVTPAPSKISPVDSQENDLFLGIIGRPNVGKSTLFNRILGVNKSLVSEKAGTTRDSVSHKIHFSNNTVNLIDTAGVRRRTKVTDSIEELSIKETISIIRKANIIIQVMDSQNIFEKQDLRLSNLALTNTSLFIFVVNKSDLIKNQRAFDEELQYLVKKKLSQFSDVKVIYTSFRKNFNKEVFFNEILELWETYNTRITTGQLNTWLQELLRSKTLPIIKGNTRLKIKYMTQSATAPPIFSFFTNMSSQYKINDNLYKFLLNSLKKSFDLTSIPVKLNFRGSSNPYANK